jgi:carbamoyltransferase
MSDVILGISGYYHDSAAVLLRRGAIVAAAQEERFTRIKHDPSFPAHAVESVLREAGLQLQDVAQVAFYEKPFIKFERLLETYHTFAPHGLKSFCTAIPVWIKEKLFFKKMLANELAAFGDLQGDILFPEHHLSHAASAFYPSPFTEAAVLTIDGVGEWATTTLGQGRGNRIEVLRELHFPHSLGLLYSAFTYYCGFRVNSGEYKLMGLAPFGNPGTRVEAMKRKILEEMVDIRQDGSLLLNMRYFDYAAGITMCNDRRWQALLQLPRRAGETEITQDYADLALAIQQITEDVVLRMAATIRTLTGLENLVLAGGVALNCVANGKLLQSGLFKNIWIQPAAGDAGGALGAAYAAWHIHAGKPRETPGNSKDAMQGSYLGPQFDDRTVQNLAERFGAPVILYDNFSTLCDHIAQRLDQGDVVGWFQGRMEFGPRALGNRSILGDARNPQMQKKLNLKIKYREGFRPFAPSVMEEDIADYFELPTASPYMLLVAPVNKSRRKTLPEGFEHGSLWEKLYHPRSDIPAVTHIDFSARIQSVSRQTNERYWNLIRAFKQRTGYGVIVNTSFNVRGEPIVCTPEDAYRCFMRTEMDWLVIGNHVFEKAKQQPLAEDEGWRDRYRPD